MYEEERTTLNIVEYRQFNNTSFKIKRIENILKYLQYNDM